MSPRENNNEEELLCLIRQGDGQAKKTLYLRYVRYLTAICSRYIRNDEDVRDVMQDAFLKIFSSIGSFEYRGNGSLKGWMAKILLNETLKFIRQNSRTDFVELKSDETDLPDSPPDTTDIPLSVLHQMIRDLPEGYRTIFNLYVIEEKSHKEIAEMLNIRESTSASQLHRAKAILADKIRRYRTINPIAI